MDINSLQQTESHPGPKEEHVITEDHDSDEEPSAEDEGLGGMSVLGLHAERSLRNSRDVRCERDCCWVFTSSLNTELKNRRNCILKSFLEYI